MRKVIRIILWILLFFIAVSAIVELRKNADNSRKGSRNVTYVGEMR